VAKKTAEPELIRPGIVPGLTGVTAMFIGMGLYPSDWYITILFVISILAAILTFFSWQWANPKKWVFMALFAAIAIYWNPIVRFTEGITPGIQWWMLLQTAAAAVFFLGGFLIRTPAPK
jgi:hypothetical protein